MLTMYSCLMKDLIQNPLRRTYLRTFTASGSNPVQFGILALRFAATGASFCTAAYCMSSLKERRSVGHLAPPPGYTYESLWRVRAVKTPTSTARMHKYLNGHCK